MNQKSSNILNTLVVVKRSGQRVNFNGNKIAIAIKQAFDNAFDETDENQINKIYENVLEYINLNYKDRKTINVEDIQDIIEQELKENKYLKVYEHFNSYRQKRTALRKIFEEKQEHKFARAVEKLSNHVKNNEHIFSDNMINEFGKIISKEYAKSYVLENKFLKLLEEGIIEINNLDEYITYKTSGTVLDFSNLKANSIEKFIDNLLRIVYNCKKEQFGEHVISSLDYIFIDIIIIEYKNILKNNISKYLKIEGILEFININDINKKIDSIKTIYINNDFFNCFFVNKIIENIFEIALEDSLDELKNIIYYNLKKMLLTFEENLIMKNSKVSISFGTNYNCEEAILIRILYLKVISEIKQLNFINTIYKIYNINEEELSIILDLIKQDKKIFLLFEKQIFEDYKKELEVFSTGERIFENIVSEKQNSVGRILLSATSVNLARLGLEYKNQDISCFYDKLLDVLEIVKNQLVQRFELQGSIYKEDYKFLFQNNLIYENNKLENTQKIRKIIRNGVFNISLVGLYECASILSNKKTENLAFEILDFMHNKLKEFIMEEKLNFILSESYVNEILEKMISIDKSIYGVIPILNKNKYDSFCKIYDDLEIEQKLKKLGKFQDSLSSVIDIKISKKDTIKEFINIVKLLQKNNIIFCKLEVKK